jgi:hypothetical protein
MDRPSYPDPFDEDRTREPVFRSDLEERRPQPGYLRPERGFWSLFRRLLAPLAALGLLLAKF